ncbi:MAG: aspartate/glutamate racemase family protein [Pyrinomonadaceae bacterium]
MAAVQMNGGTSPSTGQGIGGQSDVTARDERRLTGILGGMGPLSSAEFLKTIYECSPRGSAREQEAPAVVVYSDPSFPDRTSAFLAGRGEAVRAQLVEALTLLTRLGADRVVICCMTMHHLLPELPDGLRARVLSLLDVIYGPLEESRRGHLVLCSTGTQKLRLFQRHPRWPAVADFVVFPDAADQERLHELIYELKFNRAVHETCNFVEALLKKYEAESFVVGCSEIHMLAKHFFQKAARRQAYGCIDPFALIAANLAEGKL